jgi:hypothetical protein
METLISKAVAWFSQKWGTAAAILTGVALLITTGQAVGVVSPAMPVLWFQLDHVMSGRDTVSQQRFAQSTLAVLDLTQAFYESEQTDVEIRLQAAPNDSFALDRKKRIDARLTKVAGQRHAAECELQRASGQTCT